MHLGRIFTINKWEIKMNYIGKYLQKYYASHEVERKGLYSGKPRDRKIIVSLTSFPARFDTLYIMLRSIFNQTVKADKIILYLDDALEMKDIPESLTNMQRFGLEIQMRPYNIKPHKKYYFAIKEHPEDIVITVDDDMIYEKNLIKNLMKSYEKYHKAVSAKRVHKILHNQSGELLPYNEWEFECKSIDEPSDDLFVTGIGGALYPPHCLPDETFDVDKMLSLSANNDDIWLKFMEMKQGTKVVYAKGLWMHPCCIMETQKIALSQDNVGMSRNDEYINNLEKYYNIKL